MYKKNMNQVFFIIVFLILSYLKAFSYSSDIKSLKNLNLQSHEIKSLRADIRKTISIVKSGKNFVKIPELRFYKYKVIKNDNFWKILSKTSLNIDTLITVNSLSSPADVNPGKILFIPNMRGVVHKVKCEDTFEKISKKYKINTEYIREINKVSEINNFNKKYLFIPSGTISNIERSLFMGVGFVCPLKNIHKTSSFGRRIDPFNGKFQFHKGVDLSCAVGSKVYAARGGKVVFAGYKGGYGLLLVIKHEYAYTSYYGHLKKIYKRLGTHVKRGERVALSGNSGRSTGPHLHFEVRKLGKPINPTILSRQL